MRSSWIIARSFSGRSPTLRILRNRGSRSNLGSRRSQMRVVACLVLSVSLLMPAAADAETGRVRRVGPWNIAATTEKGVFQYCMMARPETKTSPGFGIARGASQLTLAMFSQKWKLEKGTSLSGDARRRVGEGGASGQGRERDRSHGRPHRPRRL